MRSDDGLTYLIFGGMSASLIDRVGRPELMLIKVRNVGSLGNESSESVNVGVLKGKIKEIKMKNKIEKVRNYLFTCTRDRTNLSTCHYFIVTFKSICGETLGMSLHIFEKWLKGIVIITVLYIVSKFGTC